MFDDFVSIRRYTSDSDSLLDGYYTLGEFIPSPDPVNISCTLETKYVHVAKEQLAKWQEVFSLWKQLQEEMYEVYWKD
jgi:hypothetical protein